MTTQINVCNPTQLKKIARAWMETLSKPRLSREPIPFTLVDKEKGTRDDYAFNMDHPMLLLSEVISEHIGQDETIEFSYFMRIQEVFTFIQRNHDWLSRHDLVKNNDTHRLISDRIYEAAATCKLGKRGFKFDDFRKEIQKLDWPSL